MSVACFALQVRRKPVTREARHGGGGVAMRPRSQLFAVKPVDVLLAELAGENRLRRVLGAVALTALGVGAIIGAGIFVLTGLAAHDKAGPGLILSFVVAGIGCALAALCYAEFASMVPVAGSAYTYAYATLGELFAWIIGWDLVLEYAVASSTVAHGWSHYFLSFLAIFGITLPERWTGTPIDIDPTSHLSVLTGMVPYTAISIDAPVAAAFATRGLRIAVFFISLGAVVGITSVLLVLLLSQARVLLAMARDGLIPREFFGAVHPRFRTPHKATILTGVLVATVAALFPLRILAELVNIGTLMAFVIVCAAVMVMRRTNPQLPRPFRTPFVPAVPVLGMAMNFWMMCGLGWENWTRLFVWLAVGLVIYFSYGRKRSTMALELAAELAATGASAAGRLGSA